MLNLSKIYLNKILFLRLLGLIVPIIALIILFIHNRFTNQNLILKYSVSAGVLWNGGSNYLYLIPLSGLILSVLNLKLNNTLGENFIFLKKSIVLVNVLIQLLLFSALLLLFWIN
jgi:hypothetical protein